MDTQGRGLNQALEHGGEHQGWPLGLWFGGPGGWDCPSLQQATKEKQLL